jgi:hypothetical protein
VHAGRFVTGALDVLHVRSRVGVGLGVGGALRDSYRDYFEREKKIAKIAQSKAISIECAAALRGPTARSP